MLQHGTRGKKKALKRSGGLAQFKILTPSGESEPQKTSPQPQQAPQQTNGQGAAQPLVPRKEQPERPKVRRSQLKDLQTAHISIADPEPKIGPDNLKSGQVLEISDREDFDFEALKRVWKAFAAEQKARDIAAAITTNDPILDGTAITFEVNNSVQEEKAKFIAPDLLSYLRSTLKNGAISIDIKMVAAESKGRSLITPQDHFKKMAEENPNLMTLKKMFGLEIEY